MPDRLVAEGRLGVQLEEAVTTARSAFEQRVAAFCTRTPFLAEHPVRVTWTGGSFASGTLPDRHPLLAAVRQAVDDTGGGVPEERAIPAGSDLRLYAAAGIPTLHYGPGDLRLAHGPDERVPVADVVASARALAVLAVRTCGVR